MDFMENNFINNLENEMNAAEYTLGKNILPCIPLTHSLPQTTNWNYGKLSLLKSAQAKPSQSKMGWLAL